MLLLDLNDQKSQLLSLLRHRKNGYVFDILFVFCRLSILRDSQYLPAVAIE